MYHLLHRDMYISIKCFFGTAMAANSWLFYFRSYMVQPYLIVYGSIELLQFCHVPCAYITCLCSDLHSFFVSAYIVIIIIVMLPQSIEAFVLTFPDPQMFSMAASSSGAAALSQVAEALCIPEAGQLRCRFDIELLRFP